MAKQYMNRNFRNNRNQQPRFRNRQINKARSQSRRPLQQSGRPFRRRFNNNNVNNNQVIRNRGGFKSNRIQNRAQPQNRMNSRQQQQGFQGKQIILRRGSKYRQMKNRRIGQQAKGLNKENNNIQKLKNLKFEEGLDKQLDTYWGKSTSEEAKIVYKFNCEKNMDDELESYWKNTQQQAHKEEIQQQQQQDNDHDANPV